MSCLGVILNNDSQKVTDETEDFSLVLSQGPLIQQSAEDSQERPERRLARAMKCQVPQGMLQFRAEFSLLTTILQNSERGSITNFSSFLQTITNYTQLLTLATKLCFTTRGKLQSCLLSLLSMLAS